MERALRLVERLKRSNEYFSRNSSLWRYRSSKSQRKQSIEELTTFNTIPVAHHKVLKIVVLGQDGMVTQIPVSKEDLDRMTTSKINNFTVNDMFYVLKKESVMQQSDEVDLFWNDEGYADNVRERCNKM